MTNLSVDDFSGASGLIEEAVSEPKANGIFGAFFYFEPLLSLGLNTAFAPELVS